ncbi:MAG: hypothetical protein Q9216_002467 [Gyalolechia sp. 2 TL-2023]
MEYISLLYLPSDEYSLLKHRQIRDSQACATATAYLLRRVVGDFRITDFAKLIERIQTVGQRLIVAQPKELAVGNIVRRVLGVIRDEGEENREVEAETGEGRPKGWLESSLDTGIGTFTTATSNERPPLVTTHASYLAGTNAPISTSLFNLLSHPPSKTVSPSGTPGTQFPVRRSTRAIPAQPNLDNAQDLRAEVIEGIQEIIDELNQADDQIAGYAQDHIHSNEIILTHTSSMTVQKFLLKAATKRKFTVVFAEPSSSNPQAVAARVTRNCDKERSSEKFQKALTTAGITILLVPYSAGFALMARVTKVILDANVVFANGGLMAAAGAEVIAKAARMHHKPVVVLSGVYKLSPVYPFDAEALIENGEPGHILTFSEGHMIEKTDLNNPLADYIVADLVDLYITNLSVQCFHPRFSN